jgi:YidC/Oxa1 family membrane protein insertase
MKMEDQGKRLLLAVAIAFGIMMVWTFLFPPDKPEPKPQKLEAAPAQTTPAQPGAATAAQPGAATAAQPGAAQPATGAATPPTATAAQPGAAQPATGAATPPTAAAAVYCDPADTRNDLVVTSEQVRATFSACGGSLRSWQLLGEQFHVPGDESTPEDLIRTAGDGLYSLTLSFAEGSTFQIPAGAQWKGEKTSDREVAFTFEAADSGLKVVKHFRVVPEHYLVELEIDYQVAKGPAKQTPVVTIYSLQDPKHATKGGWTKMPREWKAACYIDGDLHTDSAKEVAKRERSRRGELKWAGFIHSYFLAAVAPKVQDPKFECRAHQSGSLVGVMAVDISWPPRELGDNSTLRGQAQLAAYLGPKYLDKLESIGPLVQFDPKFEEAVDLGMWGFIAGPLLWILRHFYDLVGSWGIAIILLTCVVKLATLYWTHKSMKSMRAMAKLRPKLDEIRKKHENDKQKQQVETMNLFKAHGVNPLAGCLPILLQMPIWFALYRSLSVAAELYQAKFMWFDDLTAPDPYYVLPVFMTATMLLQSKLTPQTASGMQQKILTYGMPLMFGGFSLFFPAGLTLYISTNTVLTLLHHLYMRRDEIFAKHGAAADEVPKATVVEAPSEPASAPADEEDEGEPVAKTAGGKNGHSARPRAGQQRRRSGKRSKRGSRSS